MRLLLAVPAALAAVVGVHALTAAAGEPVPARATAPTAAPPSELGAGLYATQCASCHGTGGDGVEGRGPALTDEGRASVDFVLRTGRMPLAAPDIQAQRRPVRYTEEQIVALVEYAGAFGDGPDIPDVDPDAGDLTAGSHLFQLNCAACHVASGSGAAIGAGRYATSLMQSTPTQVGQAILVGPGAMPVFGAFTDEDIDSVAAYVRVLQEEEATSLREFGGAGPVAEGLAAWLLALLPLVALTRWIGSPHEGRDEPLEPEEPAEGIPT